MVGGVITTIRESAMQEQRIRTIQQTSKIWKFGQLAGVLTLIGSIVYGAIAASDKTGGDHSTTIALCVLTGIAGLSAYFVSRMLAWWFNG